MDWRARSTVSVVAATVLIGTGAATMAHAVSSAPPPVQKVASLPVASVPSVQPTDDPRTVELTRSVDDLLAQLGSLQEQISSSGATATPTTDPTTAPSGGQSGSTQSGSTQSGPAQSGPAQSGPAQSGPAQGSSDTEQETSDD
jgi:hypothetical protein